MNTNAALILSFIGFVTIGPTWAADVLVKNAEEFRRALASAKAGTHIRLSEGSYGAGFHFSNVRGEQGNPIVISAADAKHPPVFGNGQTALQFSNPAYLELRGLVFTNLSQNGLNMDDGGKVETPETARGIVLENLQVRDVGTTGNQDGIKLSGIWDFRVTSCTIERWGTGGGSAVDMVGCHRGLFESNVIRHIVPEPGNCTGIQGKGGTSAIVIRGNRFEHAGGRAVNIGGSTGLQFFRPKLVEGEEHAEGRDITIERNVFIGSQAPVAFVGVDGAKVRFNRMENPGRWVLRILQENRAPGFLPCRNGEFTDNTIIFKSTQWSEGGVNIGGGTAPETFKFARNSWYCSDDPARSKPKLPTPELDGAYGKEITE
jgi:hypothetical protein